MSKWMTKLQKLDGAVEIGKYDPLVNCLQSPSPYLNWSFGIKGHGLPFGYGMLLGGPAKSGKTYVLLNFIAELHKSDPEAWAVIYNTEMRTEAQITPELLLKLGVDKDRLMVYDVNSPDLIFDKIEKDLAAMCQEGFPLKLIAIDSIAQVTGRRMMNSDTVMQQQIGDQAATLQDGLMRILPVIRKNRIAFIGCTHVRDEMDQAEIMRGNKFRLKAANAAKHFFEFFCFVERNRSKSGKATIDGQEFIDESTTDAMGKGDSTGHKIRFKILGSSLGVDGRTGEFTLNFEKGIINQYEEVFLLGMNTGVIQKPNNVTYQYKDRSWRGQGAILSALKDEPSLCKEVLTEVYAKDM